MKRLLDISESLEIPLKSSRRDEFINGNTIRNQSIPAYLLTCLVDPDAVKLARKLDGLPLALATTGAYLRETSVSCADYLRLYELSWSQLQKVSPEVNSYDDRMLHSTWQLSLENIKKQNELSAKLLQFWAYFSNDDVWFELLQHADSSSPRWLQELTANEMYFTQAIRVLSEHGLVELAPRAREQPESAGYSLHSSVHSWVIHILNQEWDIRLARHALKLIVSHVPNEIQPKWWATQWRLLRHAAKYKQAIIDKGSEEDISFEVKRLIELYWSQGKLEEAGEIEQYGFRKVDRPDRNRIQNSAFHAMQRLAVSYVEKRNSDPEEPQLGKAHLPSFWAP